MAKQRRKPEGATTTNEDAGYRVLSHQCTVNTEIGWYQVVLICATLKRKVVLESGDAERFTALVALLTSGHPVYYYPAGGKVGINTAKKRTTRTARKH